MADRQKDRRNKEHLARIPEQKTVTLRNDRSKKRMKVDEKMPRDLRNIDDSVGIGAAGISATGVNEGGAEAPPRKAPRATASQAAARSTAARAAVAARRASSRRVSRTLCQDRRAARTGAQPAGRDKRADTGEPRPVDRDQVGATMEGITSGTTDVKDRVERNTRDTIHS